MRLLIYPILLVVLSILAPAQDYYADIKITVSDTGLVAIDGDTNHPALKNRATDEFTSKKGSHWLLNITIPGEFSDFVYELHLPENAMINYLKTPDLARIEQNDGIIVIGTGKNTSFLLLAQYSIQKKQKQRIFLWVLSGMLLIALSYILYIRFVKKPKPHYNPESLTERQKRILKLIEKNKKPLTQADIEKALSLPKSSVSRNLDALVKKGIIVKESKGMSNIIYLK